MIKNTAKKFNFGKFIRWALAIELLLYVIYRVARPHFPNNYYNPLSVQHEALLVKSGFFLALALTFLYYLGYLLLRAVMSKKEGRLK